MVCRKNVVQAGVLPDNHYRFLEIIDKFMVTHIKIW